MLGTNVIYLDTGRDGDDDYDDGESSDQVDYEQSTGTLCRHYEITKDFQTHGQRPCKNCEKVHF